MRHITFTAVETPLHCLCLSYSLLFKLKCKTCFILRLYFSTVLALPSSGFDQHVYTSSSMFMILLFIQGRQSDVI